jgi:leader peptidase (prepilin peptidase)/N-methyltransferase
MLNALDLIPVFSWILNKTKCKHCNEKVSAIYPLLELST